MNNGGKKMNIRISDNGGRVVTAVMDNGEIVDMHSDLKVASTVLLDIWAADFGDQSYDSFKDQLIAGLDYLHDQQK